MDKKESDIRSSFKQNYSNLQDDVISLEEKVSKGKRISDEFSHISPDPVEKLNKAKSVRLLMLILDIYLCWIPTIGLIHTMS